MDGLGLLLGAVALALLGSSLGIITGLTPGLHVNLVAQLLLVLSVPVSSLMSGLFSAGDAFFLLACAVVSCSVTHTFLDVIPSVFLGAPDPDSVLSVLPGHRMMLEGKGLDAVRLSLTASLAAAVFSMVVVPLARVLVGPPVDIYERIVPFIPYMLTLLVTGLVLSEGPREGMPLWERLSRPYGGSRKPTWPAHLLSRGIALTVLLTSGLLGFLVLGVPGVSNLSSPLVRGVPKVGLLMPLLTGLFGTSGLIMSLRENTSFPQQDDSEFGLPVPVFLRSTFTGTLAGSLVGWLPGVTSSQATVVSSIGQKGSENPDRFEKDRAFIASVSAVNTANAFFVLLALFTIGKARSGAIGVAASFLRDIPIWDALLPPSALVIFSLCAMIAALVGFASGRALAGPLVSVLSGISYRAVAGTVCGVLVLSVLLFSGPVGMLVLLPATTLGMIPPLIGVKRVHMMGSIIVPVIIFLMGLDGVILAVLGL